MEYDTVSSGK